MVDTVYDEEQMIRDIAKVFQDNLNTEIDRVNTSKGAVEGVDKLYIPNIPITDYIFETLDDTTLNFNKFFVMYGLIDTPTSGANINNFIEDVVVTFQVATWDGGEETRSDTLYQLLRYRRALKAVIMKNPDMFRGYAKPLVKALKPSVLPYSHKDIIIKIGLDITASVTAN